MIPLIVRHQLNFRTSSLAAMFECRIVLPVSDPKATVAIASQGLPEAVRPVQMIRPVLQQRENYG